MDNEFLLLLGAATSIAVVHTMLGPDHYLPFIAMAKAGRWSRGKTALVTASCGVGHAMGSVLLGLIGIALGLSVERLDLFEGIRGDLAAWALISFGLAYGAWGLKRAYKAKPHNHPHVHADGTAHAHGHDHRHSHAHVHAQPQAKAIGLAPWGLFLIFVLGPCEPMIPLMLYPAISGNALAVAAIVGIYMAVTVATMLAVVFLSVWGLRFVAIPDFAGFSHAFAGAAVGLCGVGIMFLGL